MDLSISPTMDTDIQHKLDSLQRLQEQLFKQQRDLLFHQQQQGVSTETLRPSVPNSGSTNWSFTQGLIVGQLSVIFVIAVFIKFFVFADHNSTTSSSSSSNSAVGVIINRDEQRKDKDSGGGGGGLDPATTSDATLKLNTILEKTYYDVLNHAPELLDWFTVLIAQAIQQLRVDALVADNVYHSLNDFLQTLELPDFLDTISLTEIDVGDDFPIFSNCRIQKNSLGRLEAKIDVDLSDTLTLGIKTKLLLNQPRPLTAVLPVELSVSIVRFSACLSVSMFSDDEDEGTALVFSFGQDYRLEFTVKSSIGSRAKLQDVPKIGQLIDSRLRKWFQDRCVEPKSQVVMLPSFWPRSKNTREQPQPVD